MLNTSQLTRKLLKERVGKRNLGNEEEGESYLPADFLINSKNGEVLASQYSNRLYARWNADEVIAIKRELFPSV
jgi:hypothetical protein